MSRVAIVGAGWAGLAAAVAATERGHEVTLIEATRALGGRARTLAVPMPDRSAVTLREVASPRHAEAASNERATGSSPRRPAWEAEQRR